MNYYNQKIAELSKELYGNQAQTERVIKARHFIDQHLEAELRLSQIANAVYSSPFHLNREFKRHYGITPSQYAKERRIAEAKKLLCGNSSVSDTCLSVGYGSITTFSLLFRRWTGSSPRKFKSARLNKFGSD